VKDARDTVADELKEDEKLQSLANEKEHEDLIINVTCLMLQKNCKGSKKVVQNSWKFHTKTGRIKKYSRSTCQLKSNTI